MRFSYGLAENPGYVNTSDNGGTNEGNNR